MSLDYICFRDLLRDSHKAFTFQQKSEMGAWSE